VIRSARPLALCGVLALALAGWSSISWAPAGMAASPGAGAATTIMYVAGGHLWLAGVDGAPANQINTPWPLARSSSSYQEVLWSPDHRRVAFDDQKGRLAVINLATRHVTVLLGKRCTGDCYAFNYAWSPNGRYLGFVRPENNGQYGMLLVWDSAHGPTRTMIGKISGLASSIDWSHDGSPMLVSTGPFDTIKSVFPSAAIVPLAGAAHVVARGIGSGWSQDDRFVGLVRSHQCGANICDDAELVVPSAGGAVVTLTQHIASTFEDPEWAQSFPIGDIINYGFDRWVLGFNGHIAHRVAGSHERVDSWAPDGLRLAVETYHPYESTPDSLFISTSGGARVRLYTAGRKDSCGACSKDVYSVAWGKCPSGLIAFSTPTYPTPSQVVVYPKVFLAATVSGALKGIPVPGKDAGVVGFVDKDQELVLRSGTTLYRYVITSHALNVIATHVNALAFPPIHQAACS